MSHTTLPARMREAAETLRELNSLYTYAPEHGLWNPVALEKEAKVIEQGVPA